MSIIGSALGATVSAVFDAAGQWVAGGAVWLLGQVGHVLSATTSVDLGGGWFQEHYRVMAALAAAVILPMACCGVILAVYRQDASMLVRGLLVKLPLALLFTGVSVELVRLGLAVTDDLSARVLSTGGVDTIHVLQPVGSFLAGAGLASAGAVPAFVIFVGALLVAVASLALWLELVVRAAAVAAATLFLPLALAGLVWPAVSHWCRRLAETIAALVLSKLVVAAVLSLAAGALSGGVSGVGAGDVSGGFAAVVTGIALLVIATTAPFVLLRLVPAIEAGAVLHLEGARHRLQHTAGAPVRAGAFAVQLASGAGMLGAAAADPAAMAGAAAGAGVGVVPGGDPASLLALLHAPGGGGEEDVGRGG
ncbi:MAG TPA: hypothetical protein DCQ30_09740 [Acidimicrobiaceae bacterium]|nr:hypothetical protein [Acidimicrobiaceae bacterium]